MMLLILILNFALAKTQTVIMYPKMVHKVRSSSYGNISLSEKGIVSVRDQSRSLTLVAKKKGQVFISSGKLKYEVIVLKRKTYKTFQRLGLWIKNKKGLTLKVSEQKIYIAGEFWSGQDWIDLNNYMNSSDEYYIEAKIEDNEKQIVIESLKELLNREQLPSFHLSTHPIWSMNIAKASDQKRYLQILKRLGIRVLVDKNSLSQTPMVRVKILIAEVMKNRVQQLGLQWPSNAQAQVLPNFIGPQNVFLTADAFEQEGLGRILASPILLTESGKKAQFHSGGEIPIRTSNQFNTNVVWKKYGILLKVEPKANFKGQMQINIHCEVSTIDTSQSAEGAPALLINNVSSHFNLSESKTIALSGLIRRNWSESSAGLPGLGNIPILGRLFSSKKYSNSETELVFFVTPEVILR